MIVNRTLTVIAACVLTSMAVQAQTLPEPLVQAARQAVTSNPEVQARWHGFLAASNERDVARAGYFPQIDLRASTGREKRVTPVQSLGSYSFNGTQITLNQMLFDGFFTRNEVKRLGYAKLTRYYELVEASETAALEAVRAYADVVRFRELTETAKQNYIEHKQIGGLVEERSKSGVGRGVDVEQAIGRTALAESNLLTELTNLQNVSARYLRIIGVMPPVTLPMLPDRFTIGTMPPSTDVLMRDGLSNSPTLNAAFENVRAFKTAIDTRKSAYMPRLDARAYQERDRNQSTFGIPGSTRVDGVELVLTYNLFRGGADTARERQAVELHEQARDLQEKACRDVRQTLSIAYSDVKSLNEQLRYLDQHRLSTEKSQQAYRQQFDLGQRTLLDMLNSQNEYFEANRAYINARHNLIVAQARTLSGMGQLVPTMNVNRADLPSLQDVGQDRPGRLDPSQVCPVEDSVIQTMDQIKAGLVIPTRTRVVAAPPPSAPLASKLSLAADTTFDFNKSVLKADGKSKLDALVESLKGVTVDVVIVVGHTDSVGSDAYNQRLSLARADSVKTYLSSKGISSQRIRTEGRGESQPLADNATEEGRAKNRRVEIQVVEASKTAK